LRGLCGACFVKSKVMIGVLMISVFYG